MSSNVTSGHTEGTLNESWEEVSFQNRQESSNALEKSVPLSSGQVEKLLLDAQRESSHSSHIESLSSSRGSPRSPHSPRSNTGQEQGESQTELTTDWVWDWSSRPEIVPPSDLGTKFRHPPAKPKLSIRNTRIMNGVLLSLENLPLLLVTHACTFLLGAATMLIYLKKFCGWSSVATQPAE